MVLGKRWLFSIGNEAVIRPLEKGRKCPVFIKSAGYIQNALQNTIVITEADCS